MRHFLNSAILVLASLMLSSCNTYKNAVYFQDLNRSVSTSEPIKNFSPLTVQAEDMLGISISSMNPESSAIFNFASNPVDGPIQTSEGYVVDEGGNIRLPVIGIIKVENKTTRQIQEEITIRLKPYLKEPVVIAKLLNFKISILGDVITPGQFSIKNERLSIPEALSLAGDLNITALRSIIIIREINGERQYLNVDLKSKSLFNSPNYYLKNNDIIYIEPGKRKFAGLDPTYQRLGLLFSVISLAGIFISR